MDDAPRAPWPFYTCRQAGKVLGVSTETVQGLAAKNLIERVVSHGHTGAVIYFLRKSAVDEIAARRGA